jgi:hypothetical protein
LYSSTGQRRGRARARREQWGTGTRDTIFRLFLIVSSFIGICIIMILTWDTHGLRNECRSARFDKVYMTNDHCIDAINVWMLIQM